MYAGYSAFRTGFPIIRLLPWIILVAGLVSTYAMQEQARAEAGNALQKVFDFRVDEIIGNIESRLHDYELLLQGTAGLFAASESVERDEFVKYVNALQLEQSYPGIQGVGYSQLVFPRDKAAHIEQIRKQGYPGYTIRPSGERDIYTSVIYLEPFNWRNQRAFGYDMFSEPVRRAAMELARDENKPSISGKVKLVQEAGTDIQAGFLMYVPVYRHDMPYETLQQRRANLIGWVYSPFRMNELMKGVLGKHFGEIKAALDFEIYDGDVLSPQSMLYDSNTKQRFSSALPHALFQSVQHLDVAGHRWTVAVSSLSGFESRQNNEKVAFILSAGIGTSLFLALITWLLVNGRSRALVIAAKMTRELQESETRFRAMADSAPVLIWLSDRDGQCSWCNKGWLDFTGLSLDEEIANGWLNSIHPEDVASRSKHYTASFDTRTLFQLEYRLKRHDGEFRWMLESAIPRYDDQGRFAGYIGSCVDITERKQAEQDQIRLNRALRLLSNCNMALVHAQDEHKLLADICELIVQTGGYMMAWVGYAEQDQAKTVRPVAQFGYEHGYLETVNIVWADTERGHGPTGTAIRTGITEVNQDYLANPRMRPWRDAAIQRGYQSSIALPMPGKKNMLGALTIYSRDTHAFGAEEVRLLEELASDLAFGIETLRTRAEREAAEEKLEFMAQHDPLTHLPNYLLLRDRFDLAIAAAGREGSKVGMLFLDLDNFKHINDSLGHNFGDRVLLQVVERLKNCIQDTDTISRQGGDEFVVLLSGMHDVTGVGEIAQKIIDAFADVFVIDGYSVSTSFSVGISLFPDDGMEFDTLLKRADTALYQAKDSGRNAYRFYAKKMNTDAVEQMQMQGQLRNAVKQQEFILYYQPQVDIASGRIIGAEALVRWQHPEMGLIPPGKFIPLAERSGLIIPLGEWILYEACRQAMVWQKNGLPDLVVAVNLSAIQFKRGNLLDTVADALKQSGLPAHCLELELTESILLQDIDVTLKMLQELKRMGVKLSIDDFGTGYSSLSYLKQLAVDKIKIDQSFVRDLANDQDDGAIVKAIIQLGHTLQLTVIAEGVETDEQLAFLRNNGCDEIQGYLFSCPVPAAQFVSLFPTR
ncbi:MAG: EAL domain-containing protein [Sulfuriferula sp.]|nr:EAL domain-containing protein [Sulfuriferula sp.]